MYNSPKSIGDKIKLLRKNYKLTLEELSKRSGLTKAFLSQLENNKQINPSVGTLKKITNSFGLPIIVLFSESDKDLNAATITEINTNKNVSVVRKEERKAIKYPRSDWMIELLSPDFNRKIELILTIAKPGQTSGDYLLQHEGEECGLVIKGKIKFTVESEDYILDEGDSIYLNSRLKHRWEILGDEACETIWAITPPSF